MFEALGAYVEHLLPILVVSYTGRLKQTAVEEVVGRMTVGGYKSRRIWNVTKADLSDVGILFVQLSSAHSAYQMFYSRIGGSRDEFSITLEKFGARW
ncbi:hypothetical protein PHLCEN_2v13647 [Hermanssonia centrifuga]|uniref:Uncharacterized protein n=1 Tax=Hermanssonia centrifuga TaxID=98765 RepID=A0A2R6NDV0_9APHY|nr:hypothetical protein PHLCEN_2v13647 [Hermanssonia centrifuga]